MSTLNDTKLSAWSDEPFYGETIVTTVVATAGTSCLVTGPWYTRGSHRLHYAKSTNTLAISTGFWPAAWRHLERLDATAKNRTTRSIRTRLDHHVAGSTGHRLVLVWDGGDTLSVAWGRPKVAPPRSCRWKVDAHRTAVVIFLRALEEFITAKGWPREWGPGDASDRHGSEED